MGKRQRPLELRKLTPGDLDEVMDIEPVAFGSHHWSRQSFMNELENKVGHYYACVDADTGRLVGYSGFWMIGSEAHVTTLAVHPECRRKRIGEVLLINNILASRQIGAKWLTLEVRISNEKAQNLYFKFGFRNLGILKHYYQDNSENAMILWTENILRREYLELLNERIASVKRQIQVEWVAPEVFDYDDVAASEELHIPNTTHK